MAKPKFLNGLGLSIIHWCGWYLQDEIVVHIFSGISLPWYSMPASVTSRGIWMCQNVPHMHSFHSSQSQRAWHNSEKMLLFYTMSDWQKLPKCHVAPSLQEHMSCQKLPCLQSHLRHFILSNPNANWHEDSEILKCFYFNWHFTDCNQWLLDNISGSLSPLPKCL